MRRFFSIGCNRGAAALGSKKRGQLELFATGLRDDLIPDDHVLLRFDSVLDLGWLPGAVGRLYCAKSG